MFTRAYSGFYSSPWLYTYARTEESGKNWLLMKELGEIQFNDEHKYIVAIRENYMMPEELKAMEIHTWIIFLESLIC
jgi:hypothetical protein